ncbi:TIGR00730 family Rossman fold protein [Planctomicrobium sp. SH664]|uniref:LOG family protein n=1 Tax=Planctomicrobium sp. SH664 TaxID=3448125 RepID=UPI003F5B42FA
MSKDRPRRMAPPDVSEELPLTTEHFADDVRTQHLVDEIKRTADKFARDQATRGDMKLVSRALRELRYALKVFTPYRRHRKVTVFGSARLKPDHPAYISALEFGRLAAEAGWYVVTGAGGGIMEAAHVGAGRKMSMGLNIILPFEQDANYVISKDEKLVNLRYFFTRKLMFVKEVHAVVLFPGGFGTQDELYETLTLIQTGKRELMPIILVDPPGGTYWKNWLNFVVENMRDTALISPDDLSLFKVTDDPQEAFHEMIRFYCVYNSMRYVRDKLYLRLHVAPPQEFIDRLNTEFQDIIASGKIELVKPHELEREDEHLADLPRLAFRFNRHGFSRLRQMVDLINDELGKC